MFVYIIWASFGDYSHEIDDWGQFILRRLANTFGWAVNSFSLIWILGLCFQMIFEKK